MKITIEPLKNTIIKIKGSQGDDELKKIKIEYKIEIIINRKPKVIGWEVAINIIKDNTDIWENSNDISQKVVFKNNSFGYYRKIYISFWALR